MKTLGTIETIKKGIVFDMDYTLIYPTVKFDKVFDKVFNIPFSTVSDQWLGTIYSQPLAKGYDIVKSTFPEMSPSEAQEKADAIGLEWAKVHNIYPGCVEFLSALKSNPQYKLGLLTNGPSDLQRAIVEYFDMSKYFDVIIVSGDEDVGVRKPNPEVFRIMAKKMGLPAESLFMVGDVMEKEILPAVELGWGGIWITPNTEQIVKSSNEHKSSDSIKLQDLLKSSHSIQDKPLSISWADIEVESELIVRTPDQSNSIIKYIILGATALIGLYIIYNKFFSHDYSVEENPIDPLLGDTALISEEL